MSTGRFRFLAPMPRLGAPDQRWTADVRRIEDLGFHAVVVSEHYTNGWVMDALTAVNFALASTTHLRAMPLVLNNDVHHPAMLAKAIATADVLSAGRAALGIGAGWLEGDYRALGASYDSAMTRVCRLEEALQIIEAFFDGKQIIFTGSHYRLDEFEALPRPVQAPRPPILVGGGGTHMLTIAARYADIVGVHARLGRGGFNEQAAEDLARDSVTRKIRLVTTAAARIGRPTPEFQFTCYDVNIAGVQVTPILPGFTDYIATHKDQFSDSPTSLRGDVEKCVADLQRWQEELGISYWNLGGNIEAVAPIVARLSTELPDGVSVSVMLVSG